MKSSAYLIVPAPRNYRFPSDNEIAAKAFFLGYDGYLPMKVIKNFIGIYSNLDCNNDLYRVLSETVIPENIKDFYLNIDYGLVVEDDSSALERAILLLKLLTKTYDLQSLENDCILDKDSAYNLSKSENESILMILQNFAEEAEIDEEQAQKILKEIEIVLPVKNKSETQKEKQSFECYHDLLKIRKSDLVRADFKHKLAMKNFRIDQEIAQNEGKIILYVEDASSSMGKGKHLAATKAIQSLLCNTEQKVYYYRFAQNVMFQGLLTTLEEKLEAFTSKKVYYTASCDYVDLFNQLNNLPTVGDIFMLTDGEDIFNSSIKTKHTVYTMSLLPNKELTNMCKRNGGQFLLL